MHSSVSVATVFPKRPGLLHRCGAWLCFAACLINTYNELHSDDAPRLFRAGAFAIDITPETFPVSSAGSMSARIATQAHDPLQARCLVLDDGETKLAFAICDSCMIPREIFDRAKERVTKEIGIPSDHILSSATHTHTAVTVAPVFQSEVETEYCEFLAERIAEDIRGSTDAST